MKPFSMLAAAVASLVLGGLVAAQNTFSVSLDALQEVPPVPSSGTGTATVTLNPATGAVSVSGSYSGMTSNVTLAHIHGPAPVGVSAGIIVTLSHTGGTSGTFGGSGTLNPTQVTQLLNGLHYLNVHTSMFGAGEIRGQIVATPSTTLYGGNPPGSMSVVSGTPKIGTTLTLGVDNPVGSQTPGSLPFVAISNASIPGLPIPGWGMSGPTGDLLISLASPNPLAQPSGPPWAGPGSPAPVAAPVPNMLTLIGVTVFGQGLLFDPVGPQTFGLTQGIQIYIGGP